MSLAVLSCVLSLAAPVLLCFEFNVAYVTERSVYTCTDPPFCEKMNSSDFTNCNGQKSLQSPVQEKRLTVWYTSPLNVALLLNNSEVRNLLLVQCKPMVEQPVPFEYFTVQRLEKLSVRKPGLSREVVIGRDRDAPYHEEARIAVIHTSVLTGNTELKSYTVQTHTDRDGIMSFPEIFMSRSGLSEMSRIFVTFLY